MSQNAYAKELGDILKEQQNKSSEFLNGLIKKRDAILSRLYYEDEARMTKLNTVHEIRVRNISVDYDQRRINRDIYRARLDKENELYWKLRGEIHDACWNARGKVSDSYSVMMDKEYKKQSDITENYITKLRIIELSHSEKELEEIKSFPKMFAAYIERLNKDFEPISREFDAFIAKMNQEFEQQNRDLDVYISNQNAAIEQEVMNLNSVPNIEDQLAQILGANYTQQYDNINGYMGMGMIGDEEGNKYTAKALGIDIKSKGAGGNTKTAEALAKMQTGWTCKCGQTNNTGKFCSNCGNPESAITSSGWTCICGQTNNTGKFCSNCGNPESATTSSGWTCICGLTNNTGKFCSNCGLPMPATTSSVDFFAGGANSSSKPKGGFFGI